MSTLQQFIQTAIADKPVYISDVRDSFQREGSRPFNIQVRLYNDSVRRFELKLPVCNNAEEAQFVENYLNAFLYNILSSLGAKEISIFINPADLPLAEYAGRLDDIFQVGVPISERSGYGKSLNVNQRTLASLTGGKARFTFCVADLKEEPTVAPMQKPAGRMPIFAQLPERAKQGMLMGMDIGGTDVKIVASLNGRLCAFKEYDWAPAEFERAEQLIEPLLLLTRLMRAAVCMEAEGLGKQIPRDVFDKSACDDAIASAAASMEQVLGDQLRGFDGIGLCFPDVVIRNRIVGGETYKTRGMRNNKALDYETQFAKISDLCEELLAFTTSDGVVMNTNDGPMAAFTTAMEVAAAGRDLSDGFFAFTLGTELGTGWVLPDGSIPEIPLEVYNFIIDLGSYGQQVYDVDDVRSVRNFNTGLSGTLQKYTSQSGVFRLAAKELPEAEPAIYEGAFDKRLFAKDGERIIVPTTPKDLRKPCLEYFMKAAEKADSPSAEIFKQIGEALAVTWRETEFILEPVCKVRTLFGRLVKTQACFDLLCEGAQRIVPDIRLELADETLANTNLMKQLVAHPVYTVAQFAQAVGAVYFACAGL